jgi:sterol desaturase/sphingolipid hydroxylase (fatty acid hydroxylase superfamily)
MNTREYLGAVTVILATMAVAALLEAAFPLFATRETSTGRRRANLAMTAQTLIFNFVLTSAAGVAALVLPLASPGIMARIGLPAAAQFVVGMLLLDFSFGYVAHRALHAWPILWRFHRVHHSDPFVDVTTTYRNHPGEHVWRFLAILVPTWAFGVPASAVVLYRVLSSINGVLEHANFRLGPSLDSVLSRFWVTPNMHKVHHSREAAETDTNYGNLLSLYDRVLGTFTPSERALAVAYGLEDVDPTEARSFVGMNAMPWRARKPSRTSRWNSSRDIRGA